MRPKVTELLSPNPEDYIFDIACGNGNYSSYLAQRGASVVAFDYSKKMIECCGNKCQVKIACHS